MNRLNRERYDLPHCSCCELQKRGPSFSTGAPDIIQRCVTWSWILKKTLQPSTISWFFSKYQLLVFEGRPELCVTKEYDNRRRNHNPRLLNPNRICEQWHVQKNGEKQTIKTCCTLFIKLLLHVIQSVVKFFQVCTIIFSYMIAYGKFPKKILPHTCNAQKRHHLARSPGTCPPSQGRTHCSQSQDCCKAALHRFPVTNQSSKKSTVHRRNNRRFS